MIKNWTVKTKQIFNNGVKHQYKKSVSSNGKVSFSKINGSGKTVKDGFNRHVNYLIDNKRPSHKNTNISVLEDGAGAIVSEIEKRQADRRERSLTGGGVRNYSTAFVLSLPKSVKQPTPEEWHKIGLYAVKKVAEVNNLDFKELRKLSHIVLHEEPDQHKTNHIHLLIGNVVNKEFVKGITQLKSTHAVKQSFNYSVKKLLNEDNEKYLPQQKGKRDLPLYVARAQKMKKIMSKFDSFKDSFNTWVDSAIEKQSTYLKSKKAAIDFDLLSLEMSEKKAKEMFEKIEEFEDDFETPELQNHEKISTKTDRKRRRRKKK